MQAGKIIHWKKLEFKLENSCSHSVSGDQISILCDAHLITRYTQDQERVEAGISLLLKSVWNNGEISQYCRLTIPILGIRSEISRSISHDYSTIRLLLDNVRLYCTSTLQWRLLCDGFEWFIDDVLQEKFDGCDLSSMMLCPSSIPLLGIPAELAGSCQMDPMPFMGYGGQVAEHDILVTSRVSGGWRFLDDEGWQVLPLKAMSESSIGGANTYDGHVEAHLHSHCERKLMGTIECYVGPDGQKAVESSIAEKWEVSRSYENTSGSIVLVPDLPKSVRRMNEDYAAVIFRGHFPTTNMFISHSDSNESNSSCNVPVSSQEERCVIHRGCLELQHDLVTFEESSIEEPLSWSSVAPFRSNTAHWKVHDIEIRSISEGTFVVSNTESHGVIENHDFQDERWIQQSSKHHSFPHIDIDQDNRRVVSGLRHEDPLALYINTVVHPHWSFFYWFPKNSSVSRGQVYESGKSNLLSAPFCCDGLSHEIEKRWVGVPSHWWGIHRFVASSPERVSSICLDKGSESSWKVSGGSAKFEDQIYVMPHQKVCTLEYAIGSFTQKPFMLPRLCSRVGIQWEGNSIRSLRIYLVNGEGDRRLLCDARGTYPFLPSTEQAYAGSWSSVQGQDSRGEGKSGLYMEDVAQCFSFGLLAGYGATHLRYEVLLKDETLPFTVSYPVFHPPEAEVKIFAEDFRSSCLLWPRGMGIRWGEWDWCPDDKLLLFPERREPDSVSSALDWLCWVQCVIRGEINEVLIEQALRNFYDEYECGDFSDGAKHTHSFLVNGGVYGTGIVVNHFAEIPPLALFPMRTRSSSFVASGCWGQEAWSYAQSLQYYVVSGDQPMHLFRLDDGKCVTQICERQVDGWTITQCLSLDEDSKYRVVAHGYELAIVHGGRGYFAVAGLAVRKRRCPWNFQSETSGYHRVHCADGKVVHQVSTAPLVASQWDGVQIIASHEDCCDPRMLEGIYGRLYLLYWCGGFNDSFGIYECFSDDNGFTWSEAEMIFRGGKYPLLFSSSDGVLLRAAFIPSSEGAEVGMLCGLLHGNDSDAFVFRQRDGTELRVFEDSFHIVESQEGSASWILVAHIEGEEEPSEWCSVDHGKSWERVCLGEDS